MKNHRGETRELLDMSLLYQRRELRRGVQRSTQRDIIPGGCDGDGAPL